jgi:protein-tyrosine kinase
VSKFFKALEKVEQEREPAAAPVAAAAPAVETVSPPTPVTPKRVEPTAVPTPTHAQPVTAPVVTAPVITAPVITAPRVDTPPRVDPPRVDPPRVEAPARVETPVRVEPAPRETPAAPAPTYGSPLARENGGGFGKRGFAWQMEPGVDTEPGQVDDHLVSVLEPTSLAAEQYRAVRLAIETFRHERGTRTVAITSPGRGDGRTITAINLAGALAQAPDARVVLVEADLRHPSVARALGMPAGRGLSSYLLDTSMAPEAVITRPANVAFEVVTAGAASSMPYELLKSPRLAALLAALRERFDYVVVDTPPALPYPDVGILRDMVDGFVVVVRANRTPREMLRDCTNVIGRQRGLGLIFNDDERQTVPSFSHGGEPGWRRLVPRPLGSARVA